MLADDIYSMLNPMDGLSRRFKQLYEACTKVRIQNVSDYYYESPQEHWHSEDFPNCAPPWQLFWMEWRTSPIFYSEKPHPTALMKNKYEILPNGVYKIWHPPAARAVMVNVTEPEWVKKIGGRWMLQMRGFAPMVPGAFIAEYTFFVAPDGTRLEIPTTREMMDLVGEYIPSFKRALDMAEDPKPGQSIIPHQLSANVTRIYQRTGIYVFDQNFFDQVFLALSFCNCKNVAVKKEPVPEKLRKKREKGGRLKTDAYHTIQIQPMRQILDRSVAGQKGESSLQLKIKICRGHFKHYTERPLFGKHYGTYWWPQRGKVEEVEYDVKAPKGKGDRNEPTR